MSAQSLELLNGFMYSIFGSISINACIDDEIQRRMAKASASFGRQRQRLWNNHHLSMRVKGKIYRANRAVHPPIWTRGLNSVQTTGEKAACLHDATSAFDHEDNLDGQSDKQYSNGQGCHLWKII